VGGMLASLEWVYWEALALVIGTLGVVPLSVHTIPTQVITVTFMLPLGIGTALAVRLGGTLPRHVGRAKELAVGTLVVSSLVFGVESFAMYVGRDRIFRIFTKEQEVLDGCHEIWAKVCFYNFNLSVFGINMGIATGLGMQWTLGIVAIVFLWVMGLPASYYFAVVRGQGLGAAWSWIGPPYVAINIVVMIAFVLKDWDELAALIRLREGVDNSEDHLETLLLDSSADGYGSMGDHKGQLMRDETTESEKMQ
jgi:multidrug resistance protein, MATE family